MWISEHPAKRRTETYSIYSETGKRKRQRHEKSKNGCHFCRQRRIKCDEGKPFCSHCLRLGKSCRYEPVAKRSSVTETIVSGSTNPPADTWLLKDSTKPLADAWLINDSIKGHLLRILTNPDGLDPDLADFTPAVHLHALESLNHFVKCDLSWLKAQKVQSLMQKSATSLLVNHPYLLHAVLAISSAHLAALNPYQKSYTIVARLHWQHSLRLYSPCFKNCFESQDVNAIYFASQLHAILAFLFVRLPLAQSDQTVDWLVAMRYKYILFNTPSVVNRLCIGIWEPLVKSHYNWLARSQKQLVMNAQNPISTPVKALVRYSDTLPSPMTWFHQEQLNYAAMLEHIPPINDAIGAFLSFITEAPEEYIASLRSRDTLSLLILLYWSLMVSKVEQWWLAEAANAESHSLQAYLSQLGGENMRLVLNTLIHGQENTD